MAYLRISDLTSATALTSADLFEISQSGVSLKASAATIAAGVASIVNAVISSTITYAVTSAQSGTTFTNSGASGSITFTLPTATAGLTYTFVIVAAQTVILDVGGSEVIGIGEIATSAGGSVSGNSIYSTITLKAISSALWVATSMTGTWTPA